MDKETFIDKAFSNTDKYCTDMMKKISEDINEKYSKIFENENFRVKFCETALSFSRTLIHALMNDRYSEYYDSLNRQNVQDYNIFLNEDLLIPLMTEYKYNIPNILGYISSIIEFRMDRHAREKTLTNIAQILLEILTNKTD